MIQLTRRAQAITRRVRENPLLTVRTAFWMAVARMVPRSIWLRMLGDGRECVRYRRGVAFDFNQGCPTCGKGLEELHAAVMTVDAAVRATFFETCEVDVASVIQRYLRPGDTFIDVGAQLGYFSALAAQIAGPDGQVHCFEPVPWLCVRLRRFASLNPRYHITVNEAACGAVTESAELMLSDFPHLSSHSLVPGFLEQLTVPSSQHITVPVVRLADYIREQGLSTVALIKIDVEGHEREVLRGAEEFLRETERPPVIICEVHPAVNRALGVSTASLMAYMRELGYGAYSSWNPDIPLDTEKMSTHNVVFRRQ